MAVFRVKDRVSLSRSSGETLVVRSTKSQPSNHPTKSINQSINETYLYLFSSFPE